MCRLTSRQNSHSVHTAPITISSEAVCTTVSRSSLEQTSIGVQFTPSVLIFPGISLAGPVLLFNQSNPSYLHVRTDSHDTDVNQLSNRSLRFLDFSYLNSLCNMSITRPRSSRCNSSDCQGRYILQREYWQNWLRIGWTPTVCRASILVSSSNCK